VLVHGRSGRGNVIIFPARDDDGSHYVVDGGAIEIARLADYSESQVPVRDNPNQLLVSIVRNDRNRTDAFATQETRNLANIIARQTKGRIVSHDFPAFHGISSKPAVWLERRQFNDFGQTLGAEKSREARP
jgi:hypothetical protein